MNDETVDQADEEDLLSYEVSDEALEAAAGAALGVACTVEGARTTCAAYYPDNGPPKPKPECR
jgi:hypothetical protein